MVQFRILSDSDRELAHALSLRMLEELGVEINSDSILARLEDKGFLVDKSSNRVRIPRDKVEEALAAAPKRFTLGGHDSKNDMQLGEGNTYLATDGQGCFAADMETGQRSASTMDDLLDAAAIVETLDYIQCFWPIVTAHDVPAGSRTLHELVACWRILGKHFQTDCFNETQATYYAKILRAIYGDDETIKARNPFSLVCCPVSPLCFEGPMLEGTVALGELGVPVVVLPMPISGTSAPMSLFGTVIQNNAEVLAGIAILEAIDPGRPVLYGAAPGVLDMKTSMFCVGSCEGVLQNAACAELARGYGLPVLSCGGGTDAKVPGFQSTLERTAAILTLYMEAPDIICGVGLTETAQCLHREELLLCEEIDGYCRRISKGIRGGEEHALYDDVLEAGPGGSFLAMENTVAYLRNGEHYYPKLLNREPYDRWAQSPTKDANIAACARVKKILDAPRASYYGEALEATLAAILLEADHACGE